MLFSDKQICLASVFSAAAWIAGGVMVVLGIVWNHYGVAPLGLWISSWGMVMTLARFHGDRSQRDHDIFEMGRRLGASEQEPGGTLTRI